MPGVVLFPSQCHLPLIQQRRFENQDKNANNNNIPYIPPEIIRIILNLLKDDKKTLAACASVNHTFNLHVTPILYHTVSFSYPFTFTSFANTINYGSQRSQLISHLDLSGFSTLGLQKSGAAIQEVVTPKTIIQILRSCTMLEAFSISDSLELAITFEVLQVLAFECKKIRTLDFCGLSSKRFGSALASLAEVMGRVELSPYYENDILTYSFQKVNYMALPHLKRLSFHECPIVSESSIITLLAHSPNLTHLDLGGCYISDLTLNFLATETNAPQTLTHLSLARCKNISSEEVATLISDCKQLEVLNLYGERGVATVISEHDLITILTSSSAKKFKTLDIGFSHITLHVLRIIQENCLALQYLGIAKACIQSVNHLNDFLRAIPNLRYIDLTSVPCMTPLSTASLINNLQKDHSLHIIEISESLFKKLDEINGWKTNKNYSKSRRWYYAKQTHRPDRVHSRKLDMAECGPEGMSNIFQYYSFDI